MLWSGVRALTGNLHESDVLTLALPHGMPEAVDHAVLVGVDELLALLPAVKCHAGVIDCALGVSHQDIEHDDTHDMRVLIAMAPLKKLPRVSVHGI